MLCPFFAAVDKGSQSKDSGSSHFWYIILEKLKELFRGVVPSASPSSRLIIVPNTTQGNRGPLSQHRFLVIQVFQANGNQVGLLSLLLTLPEVMDNGGQNKGSPCAVIGHHAVILENRKKVSVAGITYEISLTRSINAKNLGPNGNQKWTQFPGTGLQKLQNIRKYANRQGQVDSPRTQI